MSCYIHFMSHNIDTTHKNIATYFMSLRSHKKFANVACYPKKTWKSCSLNSFFLFFVVSHFVMLTIFWVFSSDFFDKFISSHKTYFLSNVSDRAKGWFYSEWFKKFIVMDQFLSVCLFMNMLQIKLIKMWKILWKNFKFDENWNFVNFHAK